MEPTAPLITPRGAVEGESDRVAIVSMQRNFNGAKSARPKHGTLGHCECGLLAPEGAAGNPAASGDQGNGGNPKDTTGTWGND